MDSTITREVFKKLLEPDFNMEEFNPDTYVGLAAEIVEDKELSQKVLGKMAFNLDQRYGKKALPNLAKGIEDATGLKMSLSSLRAYKWVYGKLSSFLDKIPPEFPYTAWRDLAGTPDPAAYLGKALAEGMSGAQLSRAIRQERQPTKPPKTVQCPRCGFDGINV
jgi:hypothetical protein